MRENIKDVRACYEKGLAEDATSKGRVTIRFTIGAAGNVEAADVAQSDLEDPAVGSCIAAAAGTWKFPPPESGASVVVSYPFELRFDDD